MAVGPGVAVEGTGVAVAVEGKGVSMAVGGAGFRSGVGVSVGVGVGVGFGVGTGVGVGVGLGVGVGFGVGAGVGVGVGVGLGVGVGVGDGVSVRSGVTLDSSSAVLFAGLVSSSRPVTVTVLIRVPDAKESMVTNMVTVAVAPFTRMPSSQVTASPTSTHIPWLGLAETKIDPEGSASVKVTPVEANNELLVTVTV